MVEAVTSALSAFARERVQLFINGSLVASLGKRFSSLSIEDVIGNTADKLTLRIPGKWRRPHGNDKIRVLIDGIDYGTYGVQETTRTFEGIDIKAIAADFSQSLKERKSRSFEKLKLCELVGKIAMEHKLKAKCDTDIHIARVAQHNESDISLLNRLAKRYNLIFNIKNETVVMLSKAKTKRLPLFTVSANEAKSYRVTHSTRPAYGACEAVYHDTKENKTKKVKVGKGTPVLTLAGSYVSEADAQQAAEAYLAGVTAGTVKGSVTLPGKEIRAGGVLRLTGFGEDDGLYRIEKVTHRIDATNGYEVGVEFTK